MKQQILHVIGSLNNGGSQVMVLNIYKNIDRDRFQFDFVIDRDDELFFKEDIVSLGGKIFCCPKFTMANFIKFVKWWIDFYRNHPEYKIIHAHVRSTASIYLLIGKILKRKTIIHSHSVNSGSGISSIIKNILQFPLRFIADYFLACSDEAGVWLFGKKITKKNNYSVINNSINSDKFFYDKEIRHIERNKFEIKENDVLIGNVARLYEPKNYFFLIDVFNELTMMSEKYKLLIVGDGPLRDNLVEYVNKLNLSERVFFAGARKDVNEMLNAMDFFLMPSLYEGFGISLIEAQATGLFCIASDRVPQSTKMTENTVFLELDSIKKWATTVIENEGYIRKECSDLVQAYGYDISQNISRIQEIYIYLQKERNKK